MITKFDINMFEIQSNMRICSGMDYHFDICHVFEISKFDIARFTCIYIYVIFEGSCIEGLLEKLQSKC